MNAHANNHFRSARTTCWVFFRILIIFLIMVFTPMLHLAMPGQVAFAAETAAESRACQPFTQVNSNAFGLGQGSIPGFVGERSYEVIVFNNRLYLGMEADDSLGARLWRNGKVSASKRSWEELSVSSNGLPFGVTNRNEVDHIDSLAEFGGYLYVSTGSDVDTPSGTRVFRSSTGNRGTWENATPYDTAGFGDLNNIGFSDMQVFDGWLCGGTRNAVTGAQVWCTQDGTQWSLKSFGGLGNFVDVPGNAAITSGHVFFRGIYFSVLNTGLDPKDPSDDSASLYRATDLLGMPAWQEIYSSGENGGEIIILGDFGGYLYISLEGKEGIKILRSERGNPGTWVQVNLDGMDYESGNALSSVDGAVVHDEYLYISISNADYGLQVWRTSGDLTEGSLTLEWELIESGGLGDVNNHSAQLIAYNGFLYAWTTNEVTGQQVRQTSCNGLDPEQSEKK